MSFARVLCAQPAYPRATPVHVEADLSPGLHSFTIVGLPDKAVEEAKDRVGAAIKHSGFTPPTRHNRKVVVSLAPGHLRKEGAHYDLPIALAYLLAAQECIVDEPTAMFAGELALDGSLRPVTGILSIALSAREEGCSELYVPRENAREAALVSGIRVYPVSGLRELTEHLIARTKKGSGKRDVLTAVQETLLEAEGYEDALDLSDIRGQSLAKRGLEIAASGRHNIVLCGPPGTGKTLLARALVSLLPPLEKEEALETTMLHSLSGILSKPVITRPPLRSPHHTASHVALVGGGASLRPGEVTLAHRGVLFLDEFPEFERRCIDALREPLEERVVTVSRARGTVRYPADFILIAAMNPTPLGGAEDPSLVSERDCLRYQKKISGPIMDRIDMWIEVGRVDESLLTKKSVSTSESSRVRKRVAQARAVQARRFGSPVKTNSAMHVKDIDVFALLTHEATHTLEDSSRALSLSPRSFHRVIKLARTIADLEESKYIEDRHVLEALQFRPKGVFY